MAKFVIFFFIFVCIYRVKSANILMVFTVVSRSHSIPGFELSKVLAKRGHNITFVAPYGSNEKPENVTRIVMDEITAYCEGTITFLTLLPVLKKSLTHLLAKKKTKFFSEMNKKVLNFNATLFTIIKEMFVNMNNLTTPTRLYLENEKFQQLFTSNQTFDLIIIELVMSEFLVVLGHHFKAPVIGFTPYGTVELSNMATWNPQPFAYVPSIFFDYTDQMTFMQRVLNSVAITISSLFVAYGVYPLHSYILREKFPDAPPFEEMLQNLSLVLVNGHFSIVETPRPYLPNVIPIGGMHVQPQELPTELKGYLDNASEGLVLFSLGTNLKSSDLPIDKFNTILNTLSKFPQKFLWKFENDTIENLTKNVKIVKWIPQRAVLGIPIHIHDCVFIVIVCFFRTSKYNSIHHTWRTFKCN